MLSAAPIRAYIPVRDVSRARRFYEDKVGLVAREETNGGVVYECAGGSWIFLYRSQGAGTSKASQAFWQVEDVEREVAQLKARGVQFEHYESDEIDGMTMQGDIAVGGGVKAAWFKDTEGNIMALIQQLDEG